MDNGYNIIFDYKPYQIDDCGSYYVIYENHKYIGEFKNKYSALSYCLKKLSDIF